MPTLNGIIETALYVEDTDRASKFYEDILGLRRIAGEEDRLRAYSVADRDVLLLFKRGATAQPIRIPAGLIPPHDGSGQNHFAMAISANELAAWEKHLAAHSIEIESRVYWPLGGTSIYFRDPDGNLLELATPGMWSIY
ncbi:MAG TPA: VOC family protein [Candidatus Acidoferrales bacterium]|nr:VOC family protein [Candidatus Acidoferrales bacterium]